MRKTGLRQQKLPKKRVGYKEEKFLGFPRDFFSDRPSIFRKTLIIRIWIENSENLLFFLEIFYIQNIQKFQEKILHQVFQ